MEYREQRIFISYRRNGGQMAANFLYRELLRTLGYKNTQVFFDIKSLQSGMFDDRIENEIINSDRFLLILTPGCMDRCTNEGDWVAHEIRLALKNKIDIIPIAVDAPAFNDWGANLPKDLDVLKRIQQSEFSTDRILDYCLQELDKRLSDMSTLKKIHTDQDWIDDDNDKFFMRIKSTNSRSRGATEICGVVESGTIKVGDSICIKIKHPSHYNYSFLGSSCRSKENFSSITSVVQELFINGKKTNNQKARKGNKITIFLQGEHYKNEFDGYECDVTINRKATENSIHGKEPLCIEGNKVISGTIKPGDRIRIKSGYNVLETEVSSIGDGMWMAEPDDTINLEYEFISESNSIISNNIQ